MVARWKRFGVSASANEGIFAHGFVYEAAENLSHALATGACQHEERIQAPGGEE